ncbi:GNAT family N-acetyltransferase [Acinetobacter nectaris]|uniref:GNAT family N-acetyltransferase n=1 Tax=Acinetobacter nectaris TaxID=1219382 RepID=UPI001F2D0C4E
MQINNFKIETEQDVYDLAELFNAYRVFYKQASNFLAAYQFIEARLKNKDAEFIIYKNNENKVVGFIQLYPIFSSISMKKAWILNDLYVHAEFRRQGIAEFLMKGAIDLAQQTDAKFLMLETCVTNKSAQSLYKKMGFTEDKETLFLSYSCQ